MVGTPREVPWYDRALPWVMATLLAAIVIGWLIFQAKSGIDLWLASRPEKGGFEVKQNAGGTPALREKENDHG